MKRNGMERKERNDDRSTFIRMERGERKKKMMRNTLDTLDKTSRISRNKKMFSFSLAMIIFLASFTAIFVIILPFRVEAADDWLEINGEYLLDCSGGDPTEALNGKETWVWEDPEGYWFILDLRETYTIKKVRGRSLTEFDPTLVDIYVGDDFEDLGDPVASDIDTWRDTDEWQEVDTTDKDGRYIKVVIKETEEEENNMLTWGGEPPFTIFDAYEGVAGADDWLGISSTELDDFCGEDIGYTLANALDGDAMWKHSDACPHWFILDLTETYTIKKVRGRSNWGEDPINVNIYIDDSNPPTTLVYEGIIEWQDTDEWVEINIAPSDGRYIKVEIEATEDSKFGYISWGHYTIPFTIFDAYGDVAGAETVHLLPDDDGSDQQWVGYPAGKFPPPHYTLVDDNESGVPSPDEDETYVYTDVVDVVEEFNHETSDLLIGATITNVRVNVRAKAQSVPGNAINIGVRVGLTRYGAAADTVLTTSYVNYHKDWAYKPPGSDPPTPWTKADIDALQSSLKERAYVAWVRVTQVYLTVTYTSSNVAPINGVPEYGGWDKGAGEKSDNCYAQKRDYEITVVYTDPNGYDNLHYVELLIGDYPGFEESTTYAEFRYDQDENTVSVVEMSPGITPWDLGSTTEDFFHIDDENLQAIWKFKPQWDAVEVANVDICLYSEDDGGLSDTDPYSTDDPYPNNSPDFDVVTTLLTNKLESTLDGTPDDRVDVNRDIQMNFEIRYADEPGSNDPQSDMFPPGSESPENEFGEVTLFKVAENGKPEKTQIGNPFDPRFIENGGGTFDPFPPPGAKIANHTFRLHVDMIDKDYTKGYLTNLDEIVITDRIEIYYQSIDTVDFRINVNSNVRYTVQARLDYDNHVLSNLDGDSLTTSACGGMSYDGEYWYVDVSPSSAGSRAFSISSGNEATYGITAIYDAVADPSSVIWDEILINWSADSYTVDAGDQVTITLDDIIYNYSDTNVGSGYQYDVGETLWGESGTLLGTGYDTNEFSFTPTIAAFYNYTISSFSESTYDLTANQTNCADQGDAQNISLTVKQNITLVTAATSGKNYITWGATESIEASELAGLSYASLQTNDTIQMFNTTSGHWDISYVKGGAGGFTINRWDHIQIHCKNARSFSVTPSGSVNPDQNVELLYTWDGETGNPGYNYVTWSKRNSIGAREFATNPTLNLPGQPISIYNHTTGRWKGYTELLGVPDFILDARDFDINPLDVICIKISGATSGDYYNTDNYD